MIKLLGPDAWIHLYDTSMKQTFPRQELKPLKAMLRMQEEGKYDAWGYYQHDELLAYACFCNVDNPVLLDYLAVTQENRGKGYGSVFLKEFIKDTTYYPAVMLEIEAVKDALDDADRKMRMRRQHFYERLGFRLTTTEAKVFGEHYVVLDNQTHLGTHPVNDTMHNIYSYMVPEKEAFEKNVHIFNQD